MKSKLMIPFLLILFSCTVTKQATAPVTKIDNKKRSQPNLPVHLDFNPNTPHDSVVNWFNTFFNGKKIRIITKDKVSALIQTEVQTATQNANIKWGADAEEILREVERHTRYVANAIRIDFSFLD